jgi:predicted nucleic acid-binding protein
MRVLLDTNVLLRSVEPKHVEHQAATDAIDALRKADHDLVVVPQVLYEFWSVATRPIENNGLGMEAQEAQSELIAIKRLFRFLRDERGIYSEWELLVTSLDVASKQAHDARLVAAMKRHDVTHLLTFNARHFARYPSIIVLVPGDAATGAARA